MNYRVINGHVYSYEGVNHVENAKSKVDSKNVSKSSNFKEILKTTVDKDKDFTISKHAALRLNEINFTEEDMKAVEKGFEIAKDKNSKNAVMIYKDTALIASIENKTIITAVSKERAKDNIFTNIDSVVIL
ncbi:flagellar biosynthesis protein [Clostridium sp.]|uniref:flagellar biosynthesis protein n=1 Tax=Clostridium sp. TaxID=1506 RepID=UPI0026085B6E|nr:flagellar biosynthesis protein [Clostridium sp.]